MAPSVWSCFTARAAPADVEGLAHPGDRLAPLAADLHGKLRQDPLAPVGSGADPFDRWLVEAKLGATVPRPGATKSMAAALSHTTYSGPRLCRSMSM